MRKFIVLLCMLVIGIAAAGCGGLAGKNMFTEPGEMTKIIEQLKSRDELKGKDIYVFQDVTVFYNKDIGGNCITMEIVKPGTEDVDHYEYKHGSWSGPQPVQITGSGNIMDNVIPLAELHMDKLAEMYKAAETKAKEIEGLKVEQTVVYRFWDGGWTLLMSAASDRAKYDIEFDLNGNMIEFEKR